MKSQESVATVSDDGEVEVDSEKLNALRKIVMQAIEKRSAHAEEAQQESGARRPRLFPHFVDKRILAAPLVSSSFPLLNFAQGGGIAFLLPAVCTSPL